jgi:putative endonuclease
MDGVCLYILLCADGSYYTGLAHGSLERRVWEHQNGFYPGYTATRRPVQLVYAESFARVDEAAAAERRIKGWTRVKKEALINGDFDALRRHAVAYHERGQGRAGEGPHPEPVEGRGPQAGGTSKTGSGRE